MKNGKTRLLAVLVSVLVGGAWMGGSASTALAAAGPDEDGPKMRKERAEIRERVQERVRKLVESEGTERRRIRANKMHEDRRPRSGRMDRSGRALRGAHQHPGLEKRIEQLEKRLGELRKRVAEGNDDAVKRPRGGDVERMKKARRFGPRGEKPAAGIDSGAGRPGDLRELRSRRFDRGDRNRLERRGLDRNELRERILERRGRGPGRDRGDVDAPPELRFRGSRRSI